MTQYDRFAAELSTQPMEVLLIRGRAARARELTRLCVDLVARLQRIVGMPTDARTPARRSDALCG